MASIIVTSYCQGRWLRQALDSCLAQTKKEIEVIVVLIDPIDDSKAVTEKFIADNPQFNCRYIEVPNKFVSYARNRGIEAATGKHLICCLDGDDWIHPDYLKTCAEHLAEGDIFAPGSIEVNEAGQEKHKCSIPKGPFDLAAFVTGNRIVTSSAFSRDTWKRAGGFNEDSETGAERSLEDWGFWTRAVAAGANVVPLGNHFFYHRKHPSNKTKTHPPDEAAFRRVLQAKYKPTRTIPKRFYHIWIGDQPEPEKAKKCVASWKKIHPDFDVIEIGMREAKALGMPLTTKEERVKANDYLRIKLLYEEGGIYLDNDVELIKPLDDLLNWKVFFAVEYPNQVNCAVMGGQAGTKFLRDCLDEMESRPPNEKPVAYGLRSVSRVLKETLGWPGADETYWERDGVCVLPNKTFYPYKYNEVFSPDCLAPITRAIHHWGNLWRPKVSIVIPCYNQANYLPEAIESALGQTYGNIEIVVVDDGSTAGSVLDVCRKYQEIVVVTQPNRGLPAARNTGIRQATGDWVMPLDADDKLIPQAVEKCAEKMERCDMVGLSWQSFGIEANTKYRVNEFHLNLESFLKQNRIPCTSVFKKSDWLKIGGYDELMRNGFEDWSFNLSMLEAGVRVQAVTDCFPLLYRQHPSSMTRVMKPETVKTNLDYMKGKHKHFLEGVEMIDFRVQPPSDPVRPSRIEPPYKKSNQFNEVWKARRRAQGL